MHESSKTEVSKVPQMPAGPGAQVNGLQREINTRMCGCLQLLKHKGYSWSVKVAAETTSS